MMHPIGKGRVGEVANGNSLKFGVFDELGFAVFLLGLFLLLVVKLIVAKRRNVRSRRDASNLSAQIVRLIAGKGRIGGDLLSEDAREELADFSCA